MTSIAQYSFLHSHSTPANIANYNPFCAIQMRDWRKIQNKNSDRHTLVSEFRAQNSRYNGVLKKLEKKKMLE